MLTKFSLGLGHKLHTLLGIDPQIKKLFRLTYIKLHWTLIYKMSLDTHIGI